MPENDFGDVIECNTYLEAILHLSMLFGMCADYLSLGSTSQLLMSQDVELCSKTSLATLG